MNLQQRIELALGKPLVVSCICPPIPCRNSDYCAYPDGEEENGGYGWGATAERALADLVQQLICEERLPEDFDEQPAPALDAYGRAIAGIDEKARDRLIAGLKVTQ